MDADVFGKDDAFPFQARMLKVQNESDRKASDAKIVEHLTALVVCDPINYFGVHNNFSVGDQVWDKLTDVFAFIEHFEDALPVRARRRRPLWFQRTLNRSRRFGWLMTHGENLETVRRFGKWKTHAQFKQPPNHSCFGNREFGSSTGNQQTPQACRADSISSRI